MNGVVDDTEHVYSASIQIQDVLYRRGVQGELLVGPLPERDDLGGLVTLTESFSHEASARFKVMASGELQDTLLWVDVSILGPRDVGDKLIVDISKWLVVSVNEEVMVVLHVLSVGIRVLGEVRPAAAYVSV